MGIMVDWLQKKEKKKKRKNKKEVEEQVDEWRACSKLSKNSPPYLEEEDGFDI